MQAKDELPISHVGGLPIGALTKAEWAEYMMRHCLETRHDAERIPIVGFSVNGQVLARYARDPSYAKLIETADNLDADGQPLVIASRCLLRHPLPERVATTDFFHTAAAYAEKCGVRFFLLGANEKILQQRSQPYANVIPGCPSPVIGMAILTGMKKRLSLKQLLRPGLMFCGSASARHCRRNLPFGIRLRLKGWVG